MRQPRKTFVSLRMREQQKIAPTSCHSRAPQLAGLIGGVPVSRDRRGREGAQGPGPGHSSEDRSLVVRIDPMARDGFTVFTFARIAIAVVPASLIVLFFARGDLWQLVGFTPLLGASQGVVTIVRGAVPLALFGARGYGVVLRLIATPILLVNAFSPAIFALLVDQFGWQISLYALFACSIATWIAIEFMSRWYKGTQSTARNHLATEA
jgi:MFS family permease